MLFFPTVEQWGNVENVATGTAITLPTAVNSIRVVVCADTAEDNPLILATTKYTTTSFAICGRRISTETNIWAHWVALCN